MAYKLNPTIETEWQRFAGLLKELDGVAVRNKMEEISSDLKLWNPIYWRINSWLYGWFARFPLNPGEEKLGLSRNEIGSMRFRTWWSMLKDSERGTSPHWTVKDLPFMFQEMRKVDPSNRKW